MEDTKELTPQDIERERERRLKARQESWIRNHTCKECKRNPRQNGSSRCVGCTQYFKEQRQKGERLQRKVDAQANIKN